MITLGASWVGSSAIPATAPIRPEPNAWRRHPGDGTCIAMSTGASCSSGSRPSSSRVCSSVGGAAGITESACGARFRQRGCRKCGMNALCEDCGWVCENHPDRPWEGEHACTCGAAGAPCPQCNAPARGEAPRLPDGHRTQFDKKGWRLFHFQVNCCEGFRMTATRDDAACTVAVVRKPPVKERA